MRQLTKRLTALALALVLTLSLGASAWATEAAAPTTEDMETATITINDVNNGDTAVVYQLVKYIDKYTNYEYEENFEKFLKEKAGADYQGDIGSYFAGQSANVTKLIEDFVGRCNTADSGYSLPDKEYKKVTVDGTSADVELEPGYYLIVPTTTTVNNKIYQPITVFVRVNAGKLIVYAGGGAGQEVREDNKIAVNAKSVDGPSMIKRVWCVRDEQWGETADVGVGEIAKYYVRIDLPKYTSVSALKLTVNDKMKGLSYVDGSAKVYEQEITGAEPNENALIEEAVAEPTGTDEDGTLHFVLNYTALMPIETAKQVWLYYEAEVTPAALTAHKAVNTATLTFADATSALTQTTDPQTTTVYNYALRLEKKAGDINTPLTGAKFKVYKDEKKQQPLQFVALETSGDYCVARAGDEGVVDEIPADFVIRGLGIGEWYLEESTVPTGYFSPAGMFKLTLVSEVSDEDKHTGNLVGGGQSTFEAVNEETDAGLILTRGVGEPNAFEYHVKLKNSTTPVLPSTGGVGTVAFTVAGIAIMVAAAFLVLRRKNKER